MKFVFVNIMMCMYRGGGENFDLNMSKNLSELNQEIEFIFLKPIFKNVKFKLPKSYTQTPIKSPWLYPFSLLLYDSILNIPVIRGVPRSIGQIVFELKVFFYLYKNNYENTVIHICGLGLLSVLLTKFTNYKVYLRCPGPPKYWLNQFLIKKSQNVIANGDAFRVITEKIPEKNLIRIDVGIDFNLFKTFVDKKTLKSKLNLKSNKNYIIFVGRLVKIKNLKLLVTVLLDLFEKNENWDLLILGDGPDKKKCLKMIIKNDLKDRFHFLGYKKQKDLKNYYGASDIYVLTSTYDNFPNSILEAMAMSLPVIASNTGGVKQQVKNGKSGYLFNIDDKNELKIKLSKLMSDSKLREKFGNTGNKIILDKYSWSKSTKLLLNHVKTNFYEK